MQHHEGGMGALLGVVSSMLGYILGWIGSSDVVDTIQIAALGGAVGWAVQQILDRLINKHKRKSDGNKS